MSLKNILLDVSSVLGLDISDETEKAYHVAKINEAASEIYAANDLPGCLREQLFQVDDSETFQISLPFYVFKVRGVRFYNNWLGKIAAEDMTPRYHSTKWDNKNLIRFRIKQTNAALKRNLLDISPLTFTLSDSGGETSAVTFNIVGQTEKAQRVSESVTIAAGGQIATSVNAYKSVEKIEKTNYSELDCTVSDLNGTELATIPNSELCSSYTIIMIRDDDFSPLINNSYPLNMLEILYKQRFTPFKELYDEFPCPDCDKLIAWKFIEHYYLVKPDTENSAAAASIKVRQLTKQLLENNGMGLDISIDFGKNGMFEAQTRRNIFGGTPIVPDPWITYTP